MELISDYISIKEFAKQIGITRQAVHKQIVAGSIQADRIGREYVIKRTEVTRYAQNRATRYI